jgi:hypothetical protein
MGFCIVHLTARRERFMTKKLLRYVGPIALAIGLSGGVVAAGTAGASIAKSNTHHTHHTNTKPQHHNKKK